MNQFLIKLKGGAFAAWGMFWIAVGLSACLTIIGWHMVRNGGPDSLITRVS